jgi:crotonobetainyl-CoA:carnitine CoA-transferase CaiB-like acyl-CoA transferase
MLLGLPACRVGEVTWGEPEPLQVFRRGYERAPARAVPKVIDLSALWAGPLCGAILAAMGAEVTKIESLRRPDPTRVSTPGFHRRLNGAKAELVLDLAASDDQARLRDLILDADVVITSARLRGLASIGLDPDALMALRPGLTWVAVTGYGLARLFEDDPWNDRVAFGDDAAAAGGLVGWTADGEPRFLGDALADPVTGLAAAIGALRALQSGGGVVVDAGMAQMSASAAALAGEALAV